MGGGALKQVWATGWCKMYDFNSIVEGWLVWRPTRPDRSSQSPRFPQALRETQAPHTLAKHTHFTRTHTTKFSLMPLSEATPYLQVRRQAPCVG